MAEGKGLFVGNGCEDMSEECKRNKRGGVWIHFLMQGIEEWGDEISRTQGGDESEQNGKGCRHNNGR
jgi:hypothetical protein